MDLVVSFTLAAAFVSYVFTVNCFGAALKEALALGIDNPFTRSPKLSYSVHFVLGMILSPVFLVVIIYPKLWQAVSSGIYKTVTEPLEI
jgi:hypothetical protein